jgi:YD repeat-containing protein
MSTLERNRVFEQSALEEFEQGADSVLQAAEDISICMASHMGTVVSLCQSVPSEAREPGLSELASQAGQEIAGKDYSTIRERIKKEIGTIRDTVYTFDKQAAEAQAEAIQASVRAGGMIETLGSLLEAGLLALPYEDFQETLGEFKREVEEAVPDIEEKMKYAEDILGGLQSYAALYSSDPVHLATGNFYYEKEALRVEGDPPLKLSLYYNAVSRRKGTLLRNWTHSWQIRLQEEKGGPVIDWEDGARYRFTLREGKLYQCQQYAAMELVKGEGGYRLHRKDAEGKKDYLFSGSGALLRVEEGNGRILDLRWDEEERLSFLEDKQGNSLSFRYYEDGTLETVSDHTGRSSRFAYGDGRLKGITNPMGGTEAYTYGENGKLCTIRNEEGNVIVRNHYDNRRRILRQEYPGGGEQCYLYLDRENKVRFTECDGTVTDYIHDSRLRHRKTRQEGKEEGYAYTPQGQIHCHTDARGGKEEYRYREEGEWIYRKDRDGTEEQAVYNERGRLCAFLHKDGGETTYDYDGEGRMVCVTSPMGRKTEAAYDGEGRVSALRYPGLGERSAVYDNRGRIMKLVLPDGVEYQYRYDALNRLVETWDEEGKSTRLTYDILNRLIGIILPDGEERSYDYNACGSLTEETTKDGSTRWTYGTMEELLKKTDSIGREVCFDMDSLRRITRVRLPEGEELGYGYEKGQFRPTRMPDGSSIRYDAGGNAVEVKSPGGRTMGLTYDACGRLLSILKEGATVMELTYNASGRVSSLQTFGKKTEYFYNKEGWRIRKKEEGKETAYGYDEAGRLLWEKERDEANTLLKERRYQKKEKKEEDRSYLSRYPDGKIRSLEDAMGTVLRYEYDAMGHLNRILRGESVHQSVKHNARGQVTEVCDGEGNRRTYHYDADGLLDVHTDENGNTSRYAYDLLGRLTKASQEGAPPIYYTYNGSGRLACVEQDGEKILLPEQATRGEEALPQEERDEQGRLIVLRFPGGICRYIDYTEEGMTECLTVMDGKGLLHSRHYAYDQRGNCTSVTREGRLRPEDNGTTSYAYDVLDRLTETRIDGEMMARYAYDAYGNRTYFWDRGKETFYTYDRLDRLIEERSGEGSRTYGYDRRGSLLWIKEDGETVVSCVYDGRGNLVRKRRGVSPVTGMMP